jgi:adenine deaminase
MTNVNKVATLKKAVEYREIIDVLLAGDRFADLVLCGGQLINTLTREIYPAQVAIKKPYVVLAGDCSSLIGPKTQVVDLAGAYISPGFIDSHMHFESSMLTITEFSRLSIPSGTTALIADPHEIGNALGPLGMKAMADEAGRMPNHVRLVVPALAPDCPALETAGVDVSSKDMEDLLNYPNVVGIGELQGFSIARHVHRNTPEIVTDLVASAAYARSLGLVVDGNAPGLFGEELAAHIVAAGGRCSCHETTAKDECVEKLRQGVYVFMREGSTQKNMAECIRAVTEEGLDSRRCILATDDMLADDLLTLGHMNEIVRRTVRQGVDPAEAIQMATINPATYFGLEGRGVVAPGGYADLAIIRDLGRMTVEAVFIGGELVAAEGRLLIDLPKYAYPMSVKNSVKRGKVDENDLAIPASGSAAQARVLVAIPDQNLTDGRVATLPVQNGRVMADIAQDAVHMACVERYGRNGNVGKCFVQGMGIKRGAVAESVAHDTHNIMAAGASLRDMVAAVNRVIELGGGLAAALDGKILGDLALPVGGLITDELSGEELSLKMAEMEAIVKEKLGGTLHAPFMHLSFLALSTSPKWKLTDRGLVDVEAFQVLPPLV